MVIIKQGSNYIVNFNLFTDSANVANNVVGTLVYDILDLSLVDIVVSPAVGARSLLDTDQYFFGSLLPNMQYTVHCEFEVLTEKQGLDIEWQVTTTSNEVDLSDNSTTINLLNYLDGILATEIALYVSLPLDAINFSGERVLDLYTIGVPTFPVASPIGSYHSVQYNDVLVLYTKTGVATWIEVQNYNGDFWFEQRICLNTALPGFGPILSYSPLLSEVQAWVTANLTAKQKINGTLLTYFIPGGTGTCAEPDFIWVLNIDELAGELLTRVYKRPPLHKIENSNAFFTGPQVPSVPGVMLGDTFTVRFISGHVVHYTWNNLNWLLSATDNLASPLGLKYVNNRHASAVLEAATNNGGFLPPRVTEVGRLAILTPATGLILYQTDNITGIYYFNGATWSRVESGDELLLAANYAALPLATASVGLFYFVVAEQGSGGTYKQNGLYYSNGIVWIPSPTFIPQSFTELYNSAPPISAQTTPTITEVSSTLLFDSVITNLSDTSGDETTGEITIVKTGIYKIEFLLSGVSDASGSITFIVNKNGSSDIKYTQATFDGTSTGFETVVMSFTESLVLNDVLVINATRNLVGTSTMSLDQLNFTATRVG